MIRGYMGKVWDRNLEASRQRALDMIPRLDSQAVLLDAGCGNGTLSRRAMEAAGLQEVVGLELSPSSARNAKASNLTIIRSDLNKGIPLSSESVDFVFAHHVFAHLTDHDAFVSDLHRVLKQNGSCIVSTENLSSWHNILSLMAGYQDFSHNVSSIWYLGNPLSPHYRKQTPQNFSPHFKIFTPRSLRDLFEAHGLQVDRWLGTGCYPLPRTVSGVIERLDPWHSQFITIKATKRDIE